MVSYKSRLTTHRNSVAWTDICCHQ